MQHTPTNVWPLILPLARRMGATDAAIAKWRKRGVPAHWQIKLIVETKGAVKPEDFARLTESRS